MLYAAKIKKDTGLYSQVKNYIVESKSLDKSFYDLLSPLSSYHVERKQIKENYDGPPPKQLESLYTKTGTRRKNKESKDFFDNFDSLTEKENELKSKEKELFSQLKDYLITEGSNRNIYMTTHSVDNVYVLTSEEQGWVPGNLPEESLIYFDFIEKKQVLKEFKEEKNNK